MTTVADLIERTYRTYLYPPDYEPAMVSLNGAIGTSDTTITLDEFVVPEDEDLLRIGALIELDRELVRVTDWDNITRDAIVVRAQRGTVAATHADGIFMVLMPSFPRIAVYEAIRDNIIALSPQLFTVGQDLLVDISAHCAPIADDLAVDVIEAWQHDAPSANVDYDARIVDWHPRVGGRAVVTNLAMGTLWIRYKRRMGVVADETDDLADLGVETVWETIIMTGVAADLLVGRDIPQSQAEFIGSVLQAENIPIGQRTSIAVALSRYRDVLINRYQNEMRSEYRVKVHMRNPFEVRTRPWFG